MASPQGFGQSLRVCRWGVVLALTTMLLGFGLGGVFGAFEAPLKAELSARAEAAADSVYGGDSLKMKSVVEKSWSYYKRAHLHGGAIGTAALGAILLLASLRQPPPLARRWSAAALGAGGLGYTTFWLLAARSAPNLGSTHAAKEALSWLAVPSAGLLLFGLTSVLVLTAIELFSRESVT